VPLILQYPPEGQAYAPEVINHENVCLSHYLPPVIWR
jgi:hypothetical protein